MIATFDYQERIRACAHWAEAATNERAKAVWKDMERFWRQRAARPTAVVDVVATHVAATPTRTPACSDTLRLLAELKRS